MPISGTFNTEHLEWLDAGHRHVPFTYNLLLHPPRISFIYLYPYKSFHDEGPHITNEEEALSENSTFPNGSPMLVRASVFTT